MVVNYLIPKLIKKKSSIKTGWQVFNFLLNNILEKVSQF